MKIKVLKSKIHNATVTCHNINYDGSIGIDAELIEAGNFKKFEKWLEGKRFNYFIMIIDSFFPFFFVYFFVPS